MVAAPRRFLPILLLLLAFFLPIALYYVLIGRAPFVTPAQARAALAKPDTVLLTLDLLPRDLVSLAAPAFPSSLADLQQVHSSTDLPPMLRDHTLLLLCPAGIDSARAAAHLRSVGIPNVYSISGGLQEWIASSADTPSGALAFRPSPLHEQALALFAFFGLKSIYTLLCVLILFALRGRSAPDLRQLRFAMLAFFLGEAACAVNVLGFHERSLLLEYLHSFGMVLTFGFTALSIFNFLDLRLIHCTDDARCSFTALCQGCIKHTATPCGLRRLFLVLIPATALLAILPLNSSLRPDTYNTLLFKSVHTYHHPLLAQVYELRVLPLAAILLLTLAFLVLLLREKHHFHLSKLLCSAALGALGFSFLRLLIVASFIDNQVYFALWEELTELLFIGSIAGFLYTFRRTLLPPLTAQEHP